MSNQRIAFIEYITQNEIKDLKKRGLLNAFNMNRISKNYKKDMKAAKADRQFDDAFTEEGYKNFLSKQEFMMNKPTKRQIRIVEHFVKKTTKKVMNEGSTQQIYSKILEMYRQGTEYDQSAAEIKQLTKSLADFFNGKLKNL